MKYKDWLNDWLTLYVKPTVKIRTYEKYSRLVALHISPQLGDLELIDLTAITLQKFVVGLSEKGLSPSTVNAIITVMQKSLKTAIMVGVADKQFSGGIRRPKMTERKVNCLTLAEQRKIENYILKNNKVKLYGIILCLYTGLRIGELIAIDWTDIDLSKGLLTVNKSCHYGKDESGVFRRIIDTPKTQNSVRTIPLPKQLIPLLKEMKRGSQSDFVIANKTKPISVRSYQKTFEVFLRKLSLPHYGFHSLRHTFATRALECGMDVKTLSEILGHKNPTITLSRYAHSMLHHKTEMMNRLGKGLQL